MIFYEEEHFRMWGEMGNLVMLFFGAVLLKLVQLYSKTPAVNLVLRAYEVSIFESERFIDLEYHWGKGLSFEMKLQIYLFGHRFGVTET